MNEHPHTEAPREYGELYYSADAVAAFLRVVAQYVEADKRQLVLRLSHSIPTTMPWAHDSPDLQQPPSEHSLCRFVQFGIRDSTILGSDTLRLTALLRNGPNPQHLADWEYLTGMADQQSNGAR